MMETVARSWPNLLKSGMERKDLWHAMERVFDGLEEKRGVAINNVYTPVARVPLRATHQVRL